MTDDLEPRLAEALRARARVDADDVRRTLDAMVLPARRSSRRRFEAFAAAVVVLGLALGAVAVGLSSNTAHPAPSLGPNSVRPSGPSGSQPNPLPAIPGSVTATDVDGMFRLLLTMTRSSQESGTPIDVLASLTYLGPQASIVARSGDRLVYFHAQRDRNPQIGGPWLAPCFAFPMSKGQPVQYRLTGAVPGFENVADSSLRLPSGVWHIRATADPSVTTCGADSHNLAAEITIEVLGPDDPRPSPSATPVRSDPGPS